MSTDLLLDALAYWEVLHAELPDCNDPFTDEVCVHDDALLRV